MNTSGSNPDMRYPDGGGSRPVIEFVIILVIAALLLGMFGNLIKTLLIGH